MATHFESEEYAKDNGAARAQNWLKFGILAAASALAGGVAVAFWYRKTLFKLHQAATDVPNDGTRMAGDEGSDDA